MKKIKKLIRKFIRNIHADDMKFLNKKIDKNIELQQNLLSLEKIQTQLDLKAFFPSTNWSLPPRFIEHVLNEIVINHKKEIVEFGSGYSTICIAQFLKSFKAEIKFYSIESDLKWFELIKQKLIEYEIYDYVHLVYVPIKVNKGLGDNLWYDVKVLEKLLTHLPEIDLVVVDGPVGAATKNSRMPAIPYLKDRLCNSATIFLDDTNRVDEKFIIESWAELLQVNYQAFGRYGVISLTGNYGTAPFGS